MASATYVANGNIKPNRFVKMDTSVTPPRIIQASAATDDIIGVSQIGTHNPPISALNDGYAATAGMNCKVWIGPDRGQVEAGAAFNSGAELTADSQGRAVAASTGNKVGGYARGTATAAGQLIEMQMNKQTL